MALDFPTSPSTGQKYPASPIAGIPTYTWDGEKWTTSGASIGQYVAKTGDTMTGDLTITKGTPRFRINATDGAGTGIIGQVSGSSRWSVNLGNSGAETGGNTGSDFALNRFNDAGVLIDNPLYIPRSNGLVSVIADPVTAFGVATKQYVDGHIREKLTAARTYFVSTSGSDSNDGLTSGTPFLTIQKAINTVANTLDLAGFFITIQVANGTYTGGVTVANSFVGNAGSGGVKILGDPITPSNVVISTTGTGIVAGGGAQITVSGLKLVTATSGNCLGATNSGTISISGPVEFGACAGVHMQADFLGKIIVNASYLISGGAIAHFNATAQGQIVAAGITVTCSGAAAFSAGFAIAQYVGLLYVNATTFAGATSFTGIRYTASANGVIFTNSGGANYFPGSVAGSVATGGQYL